MSHHESSSVPLCSCMFDGVSVLVELLQHVHQDVVAPLHSRHRRVVELLLEHVDQPHHSLLELQEVLPAQRVANLVTKHLIILYCKNSKNYVLTLQNIIHKN